MSDLPTLTVPIVPGTDLLAWTQDEPLSLDGPLPTVEWLDLSDPNTVSGGHRPLRAGDRVTLASTCTCDFGGRTRGEPHEVPFATATVANIEPRNAHDTDHVWLVTVTNVSAIDSNYDMVTTTSGNRTSDPDSFPQEKTAQH